MPPKRLEGPGRALQGGSWTTGGRGRRRPVPAADRRFGAAGTLQGAARSACLLSSLASTSTIRGQLETTRPVATAGDIDRDRLGRGRA
jgi:hypothetical protein